ncbi:MAG TPA: PRC-barrel domain-containing protein [Rubrobacteraceae bacterium]|nr:PRC-barrel domain-containing protein [Rubrobacteraceae bacterium]
MEERSLIGLEARTGDGTEVGRVSEVITDELTGEVTHVLIETEDEELLELPITDLVLNPEADFATFHADPSDEDPGDHVGDAEAPQIYSPARSEVEDYPHEGQFATTPTDPEEAQSRVELDREVGEAGGWQDEAFDTADSGFPRTDAFIDPDTGQERHRYPEEGNEPRTNVEQLLDRTDLRVREVREGVVELEGAASRDDLEEVLAEIAEVDGVLDVDTTDVDVG